MQKTTVKTIATEDALKIEGLLIPFGDEQKADLDGEWFTKNTRAVKEWFDALKSLPILVHHDLAEKLVKQYGDIPAGVKLDGPVGKITSMELTEDGYWVEGILAAFENAQTDYVKLLHQMAERGLLHWSSGALPQRARRKKSGEITEWVAIEATLTPTPANPYDALAFAKAISMAPVEETGDGEEPSAPENEPDSESEDIVVKTWRNMHDQPPIVVENNPVDIIIQEGDFHYRVGYNMTEDAVKFAPRDSWVRVERVWQPVAVPPPERSDADQETVWSKNPDEFTDYLRRMQAELEIMRLLLD